MLASSIPVSGVHGRLLREHGELATAAADFSTRIGLQQLSRAPDVSGLQHAGVDYIMAYAGHMEFEEAEVLPTALKVLSDEQWNEIRLKLAVIRDPLFSRDRLSLYDNLYDAMMGEAGQIAKEKKN